MQICLWGVRGTVSTPEINKIKTGGHTTCIEVIVDDKAIVVLDAGTGLISLGKYLLEKYQDIPLPPIYIFLTHTHWDHIEGFPFFGPLYQKGARIQVYGPTRDDRTLEELILLQMDDAFCPINYHNLPSFIDFYDIEERTITLHNGLSITSKNHIHPGGAYSYRIEYKGKVFVFNTDVEHYATSLDQRVVDISQHADLMIHDAQYTSEQIESRIGWGHSTWEQALEVAKLANVKRLGFTHHDPERTDKEIDMLEKKVKKIFPHSFFCREGMIVDI